MCGSSLTRKRGDRDISQAYWWAILAFLAGMASPHFGHAQGFPKIPQVDNLTEGFRIEKTFKSIAVAPSDPEVIYIGTTNGLIYTSKDGGDTWVEQDLVNRPRALGLKLKVREGLPVQVVEYGGESPNLGLRHYAEVFNWPGTPLWQLPSLDPSTVMEPYQFRFDEVVPGDLALFEAQTGAQFEEFFSRDDLWRSAPPLAPQLGFGPRLQPANAGDKLTVNWLAVHPEDAETVFAATTDGLFRSDDGGYSWVREFDNPLADRRISNHVAFYPKDPNTRFLCTKHGLFFTDDNGETYSKVEDSIIQRIGCNYVTFHPERPRELWVGTVFGVWVSRDFGETFDLEFYTRVPGQIQIKKVEFDPDNPDNILLGSGRIVFLSRDGGESFHRLGVYSFTKQQIRNVLFSGEPGNMVVATDRDVWRTTDWGKNWESVVFGNTGWLIQWMTMPRGEKGPLWVLSEGELLELSAEAPRELTGAELDRLRSTIEDEPTITATMIQALRSHRVMRPWLNRKRKSARWSHLLPKLQAAGTYRRTEPKFVGRGLIYGSTGQTDGRFPRGLATRGDFDGWHLEVFGWWDLNQLIFDRRVMPSGQNFQYSEKLVRSLREDVQLVYSERRRLQIKMITENHGDARRRLMRRMRIEELTELLDIMTDGWFGRHVTREEQRVGGE